MSDSTERFEVRSHNTRKVSSITSKDSGYIWSTSFDTEQQARNHIDTIHEGRTPDKLELIFPNGDIEDCTTLTAVK